MSESTSFGKLTVIYGPMFAGKTTELLRLIDRTMRAKKRFAVFKPIIDNRYGLDTVVTHNMVSIEGVKAIPVKSIEEILSYTLEFDVKYVFIDELQLFSDSPMDVKNAIEKMLMAGSNVVASGLNTDFKGDVFPIMKEVIPIADEVIRLTAICSVCGEDAVMTQRLDENGNPVHRSAPLIQIGGSDSYEARCRKHHEVL